MPHLAPEDDANKDDEGEGAHTSSDAHGTEAGGSSSASVSSSISAVVALALLAILFA